MNRRVHGARAGSPVRELRVGDVRVAMVLDGASFGADWALVGIGVTVRGGLGALAVQSALYSAIVIVASLCIGRVTRRLSLRTAWTGSLSLNTVGRLIWVGSLATGAPLWLVSIGSVVTALAGRTQFMVSKGAGAQLSEGRALVGLGSVNMVGSSIGALCAAGAISSAMASGTDPQWRLGVAGTTVGAVAATLSVVAALWLAPRLSRAPAATLPAPRMSAMLPIAPTIVVGFGIALLSYGALNMYAGLTTRFVGAQWVGTSLVAYAAGACLAPGLSRGIDRALSRLATPPDRASEPGGLLAEHHLAEPLLAERVLALTMAALGTTAWLLAPLGAAGMLLGRVMMGALLFCVQGRLEQTVARQWPGETSEGLGLLWMWFSIGTLVSAPLTTALVRAGGVEALAAAAAALAVVGVAGVLLARWYSVSTWLQARLDTG